MTGIKSAISAIAVHPKKKLIAAAGSEGFIVFWDYEKCGELVFN
jgi:WD40 repeat protein